MKKLILVIATLLSGMLTAGAQELTIPQIRAEWPKAAIQVPQVKGRIGIPEFAYAVAKAFPGNDLTDELKAQLDNPGRENEDVDEFVLDRQNGYCSLGFISDGTVNMEMCYWNRKDGRKLVAVKLFNVYEDKRPLMLLYNYNPENGYLEPELDIDIFAPYTVLSFSLPREGKDIEVFLKEFPDLVSLRYDGDGGFEYDIPPMPIVGCFLVDTTPTNIRRAPKGEVIMKLDPDECYMMTVVDPTDGWWRILGETVLGMDDEVVLTEDDTQAWIHYSVIGAGLRNYGGEKVALRESPSEDSKVVGTIDQQEALVNPLDVNSDGSWVKVKWGKLSGWLDSEWLCGNSLTTCP